MSPVAIEPRYLLSSTGYSNHRALNGRYLDFTSGGDEFFQVFIISSRYVSTHIEITHG